MIVREGCWINTPLLLQYFCNMKRKRSLKRRQQMSEKGQRYYAHLQHHQRILLPETMLLSDGETEMEYYPWIDYRMTLENSWNPFVYIMFQSRSVINSTIVRLPRVIYCLIQDAIPLNILLGVKNNAGVYLNINYYKI